MLNASRAALRRLATAGRGIGLFLLGLILIVLGIVMLFTPGQGLLSIVAGIMCWAQIFPWARALEGRLARYLLAHRRALPARVIPFLERRASSLVRLDVEDPSPGVDDADTPDVRGPDQT